MHIWMWAPPHYLYTSTSLPLTYEHSQACFPTVYICEHKPKTKKKWGRAGNKTATFNHLSLSFTMHTHNPYQGEWNWGVQSSHTLHSILLTHELYATVCRYQELKPSALLLHPLKDITTCRLDKSTHCESNRKVIFCCIRSIVHDNHYYWPKTNFVVMVIHTMWSMM